MVNQQALFIPDRLRTQQPYAIRHNIAAIELVGSAHEGTRLGAVMPASFRHARRGLR